MPDQATREKHKREGTESIPNDGQFMPTGKKLLKFRKFAKIYCMNGRDGGAAYREAYNTTSHTVPQAVSRLLKKDYIQRLISEFEEQAFEESTVTVGWAVHELKDIVAKAKASGRYKEAIVAIDNIMRYSGKIFDSGNSSEDQNKSKGMVWVTPTKKKIGDPVYQVDESEDIEAEFNALDTSIETVNHVDVTAGDLASKEKELDNLTSGSE